VNWFDKSIEYARARAADQRKSWALDNAANAEWAKIQAQKQMESQPGKDVWITSIDTTSQPIDQLGLVFGAPAGTMQRAMSNLQNRAHECGADAVIGATFIPIRAGGQYSSTEIIGYGTAVRWRPEQPDTTAS
jgi:hypothetical protein